MTNEQLTVALELARGIDGFRFTNIGDISCDVEVRSDIYLDFNIRIDHLFTGGIGISHESNHSFTTVLQD